MRFKTKENTKMIVKDLLGIISNRFEDAENGYFIKETKVRQMETEIRDYLKEMFIITETQLEAIDCALQEAQDRQKMYQNKTVLTRLADEAKKHTEEVLKQDPRWIPKFERLYEKFDKDGLHYKY